MNPGEQFDLVFHTDGTPEKAALAEACNNCTLLSCERTAGETGGLLEKISSESESVTLP